MDDGQDVDDGLSRRAVVAGLCGVLGYQYGQDYLTFALDAERYVEPNDPTVEEVANDLDDLTGEVDLGTDFTYKADAEWFRPAGEYLEDGYGDCEDHAMATASILENLDRDWRMVVRTGHTETQFDTDDGVYRWHVGDPEDPEPRGDQDFRLMWDLDNGWDFYDEEWNTS